MTRPGNIGVDFGRLLAVNTSAEYRRTNTERLIKRYLERLEKCLGETPSVTFEQLIEAYNQSLSFVAFFAAYGAPSYYNMESVVGSPPNENLREELLLRTQGIIEDALKFFKI